MTCSSLPRPGYHPTIFHNLEPVLPDILHLAQNILVSSVSKGFAKFWSSGTCSAAKKATLTTHFFQKLKVTPDSVPPYIREKLTAEKIQFLVDSSTFKHLYPTDTLSNFQGYLGLHKAMKTNRDPEHYGIVLHGIHTAEQANDWASAYFLARLLKRDGLYSYNAVSDSSMVRQPLPFSCWLLLLQSAPIIEHLLPAFQLCLPDNELGLEHKVQYAPCLMEIYSRPQQTNEIKNQCLKILFQLTLTAEGRKVFYEAGGVPFLAGAIRSPNQGCVYNDPRVQAKFALASLMRDNAVLQEIISHERLILRRMLMDLEVQHMFYYSADAYAYFSHLLGVIPSLISNHEVRPLIVLKDVLDTCDKIVSWCNQKPHRSNDQELRNIPHVVIEAKKSLELIPLPHHRVSIPPTLDDLQESSSSPSHANISRMGSESTPPLPQAPPKPRCCVLS